MDAEVQQFIDLWKLKSEAKEHLLIALGAAKLADYNASQALTPGVKDAYLKEAEAHWNEVERLGITSGEEGKYYQQAFDVAQEYVDSHPKMFASYEYYVTPEGHNTLHTLISALSTRGDTEAMTKLVMFELVRFERQHIGQATHAVVRKV